MIKNFNFSFITEPHTLTIGSSTAKIKFPDEKKAYNVVSDNIRTKDLAFIKRVKSEILKNADAYNYAETKTLTAKNRFFDFWCTETRCINFDLNGYEVDLNAAYWYAALNLSLICEETFNEGLTKDKKIRLMAVGSIASRKNVFDFDGNDYNFVETIENTTGQRAFSAIADYVTDILINLMDRGDIFMYWVDAAFCFEKDLEKVKFWFDLCGMPYKIQKIDSIQTEMKDDGSLHILTEYTKNKEKIKKRYIKKAKNKKTYVSLRDTNKKVFEKWKSST